MIPVTAYEAADLETTYGRWIAERYPTPQSALGKCASATLDMVEAFPWLVRVRGVVVDYAGYEHLHWWCKCPRLAQIIDPTAKQFPGIWSWEELPDDDPRCMYPRQKCMNCGTVYYEAERKNVCSENCSIELMAYLNS